MLLLPLVLGSVVSSTLGPGRGAWKKGNPQKLGLIPSKLVQAAQQYVLFVCFLRTFFGKKENRRHISPSLRTRRTVMARCWRQSRLGVVGADIHNERYLTSKILFRYSTLASPTCFAIIRDGELVLDKTYGFGAKGRRVESMSAGKTATAAVMGVVRCAHL